MNHASTLSIRYLLPLIAVASTGACTGASFTSSSVDADSGGQQPTADAAAESVPLDRSHVIAALGALLWRNDPVNEVHEHLIDQPLATREDIYEATRRLLQDERASDTIATFTRLWLLLDRQPRLARNPRNPLLAPVTTELEQAMRAEVTAFVAAVLRQGPEGPDGLSELFTADWSILSAPLAAFYGVPHAGESEPGRVTFAPGSRAGVLTHGDFFLRATGSFPGSNAPVRGHLILQRHFCADPIGMTNEPLPPPIFGSGQTNREFFQTNTGDPPRCTGCHTALNPLGFALERFDDGGRLRESENGKAIDDRTTVDLNGSLVEIRGARELGTTFARSFEVQTCIVRRALQTAGISNPSEARMEAIRRQWEQAELSMPGLFAIVAIDVSR